MKIIPLSLITICLAWNNNSPCTVSKPGKCQRAQYNVRGVTYILECPGWAPGVLHLYANCDYSLDWIIYVHT